MYKKVGIICAVEEEAKLFYEALEADTVTKNAVISMHDGWLCGRQVAVVCCGVGKINAAAGTQLLIDRAGVDAVIMAGSAGAMDASLGIADVVAVTQSVFHDTEPGVLENFYPFFESTTFKSNEQLVSLAQRVAADFSQHDVRFGRAASGDLFIADDGRESIIERFSPLCVDMETASVAQVCHLNGTPFFAVRCISDTPRESGISSFERNLAFAAQSAFDFTTAMLKSM